MPPPGGDWTSRLLVASVLTGLWQSGIDAAEAVPPQAELVFADSFDRVDLNPLWQPRVGSRQVADGALHGQGPEPSSC
jgi:hypothetical protein